jgi:hypothetical protein
MSFQYEYIEKIEFDQPPRWVIASRRRIMIEIIFYDYKMTNIYEVLDDMFIESSDYEFVLSLEDINEIVQYAGKLGAKRNRTPKIYTEEQKL